MHSRAPVPRHPCPCPTCPSVFVFPRPPQDRTRLRSPHGRAHCGITAPRRPRMHLRWMTTPRGFNRRGLGRPSPTRTCPSHPAPSYPILSQASPAQPFPSSPRCCWQLRHILPRPAHAPNLARPPSLPASSTAAPSVQLYSYKHPKVSTVAGQAPPTHAPASRGYEPPSSHPLPAPGLGSGSPASTSSSFCSLARSLACSFFSLEGAPTWLHLSRPSLPRLGNLLCPFVAHGLPTVLLCLKAPSRTSALNMVRVPRWPAWRRAAAASLLFTTSPLVAAYDLDPNSTGTILQSPASPCRPG